MIIRESELRHWGIPGQKWGIRRWQNEDGSLTEAGRKRYGTRENFESIQAAKAKYRTDKELAKVKAKQDKLDQKENYAKQREAAKETARLNAAKQQEEKVAKRETSKEDLDYIKEIRKKKLKDLSSQELADLKQRLNEEKQVKSAKIDALTGTDAFLDKMKKQAFDTFTGIAKDKLKTEVEKKLKDYLGITPSELDRLKKEANIWKEKENISNSKKNVINNTRQEEALKKLLEGERSGDSYTNTGKNDLNIPSNKKQNDKPKSQQKPNADSATSSQSPKSEPAKPSAPTPVTPTPKTVPVSAIPKPGPEEQKSVTEFMTRYQESLRNPNPKDKTVSSDYKNITMPVVPEKQVDIDKKIAIDWLSDRYLRNLR